MQSAITSEEWKEGVVDYEQDSHEYLEKAKKREDSEKKTENLVPPDKTGKFPKGYKVFVCS
jgi:hypothetical protein